MDKLLTKYDRLKAWQQTGLVLILAFFIVLVIAQLRPPERSVMAYCTVFRAEKSRLVDLPGDTWPSSVFNEKLSDASEFVASFNKLEKVAPYDIRPDVATLKSIYQKIYDDPSQALAASLSGYSAEEGVKHWTARYCR